ncbi:MAG: hypothetical protein V2A70_06115 [Candidatus Omnitrophota bacterium]
MNFANESNLTRVLALSQWEKVVMTLVVACCTPPLFHTIPFLAGPELGMRWLPIFYAPLMACVLFRPHVSIVVGVCAPLVNHVLFGMPNDRVLPGLIFELVVFNAILAAINARERVRGWHVVLIFIMVKSFSLLVFSGSLEMVVARTGYALLMAWPGILILAVLAEIGGRYMQRTD